MNPALLPKVRSEELTQACRHMPCTLRLATFIPAPCAHRDTVVGCHLPVFGKGVATKVSDLFVAAGCLTCHDMLDGRDPRGREMARLYPSLWHERIMLALCETQAHWLDAGLLLINDPNLEII